METLSVEIYIKTQDVVQRHRKSEGNYESHKKRRGSTVEFDRSKIENAIRKANAAVDENERIEDCEIVSIADISLRGSARVCWWKIFRIW